MSLHHDGRRHQTASKPKMAISACYDLIQNVRRIAVPSVRRGFPSVRRGFPSVRPHARAPVLPPARPSVRPSARPPVRCRDTSIFQCKGNMLNFSRYTLFNSSTLRYLFFARFFVRKMIAQIRLELAHSQICHIARSVTYPDPSGTRTLHFYLL